MNIWGIEGTCGEGENCPVVPADMPLHKRILLTFFRFGICPVCITMSMVYAVVKPFKKR